MADAEKETPQGTPSAVGGRPAGRPDAAQGPLDLLESVAFIEGDANVAPVDEVAPGAHRSAARGIVLDSFKMFGALLVALVAVVAAALRGEDPGQDAWVAVVVVAVFVVVAPVVAVVGWRTRTWELTDDELVLRSGVFVRAQRRIPYQRVHSVDLSASVLERLLGVVTLTVDTGAGEVGEGNKVKHLLRADGEALKRALFARRVLVGKQEAARAGVEELRRAGEASAAPAGAVPGAGRGAAVLGDDAPGAGKAAEPAARAGEAAGDVVYEMRLSNRLHVLAAVTDFNMGAALLALFVAALGVLQFADELFGERIYALVGETVGGVLGDVAGQFAAIGVAAFLPLALMGIATTLVTTAVVAWVVSTVLAYVRWGGFVLRRRGERIEVSSGLLSRSTRAVELNRVQSVSVDQSPLRRAAGYVQVAVRTVGAVNADSSSGSDRERVVVHPCIPRAEAAAFVAQVLPEFAEVASVPVDGLGLHRLPGAALRRTMLRGAYWTAFFAAALAALTWLVGWFDFAEPAMAATASAAVSFCWALAIVGCVAMFAVRALAWRIRRIGTHGPVLVTVDGGVGRSVTYMARTKLQSLTRRVSPFQARAGVATVATRGACTSAEGDPRMRDVEAVVAEELMAWVRPHYDNAEQARAALRAAGLEA